jgi:hypothetical protein
VHISSFTTCTQCNCIELFGIFSHNDLAERYREFLNNTVYAVDLRSDLSQLLNTTELQADIPKLLAGKLGGQVVNLS